MTANDILQRALALLGYAENNGNTQLTQRILQKAFLWGYGGACGADFRRVVAGRKYFIRLNTNFHCVSNNFIEAFSC